METTGFGTPGAKGKRLYDVYVRRKYDEPLRHIGTVTALDDELAKVYANTIYNEELWIEMILYPRDAAIEVIRPTEILDAAEDGAKS